MSFNVIQWELLPSLAEMFLKSGSRNTPIGCGEWMDTEEQIYKGSIHRKTTVTTVNKPGALIPCSALLVTFFNPAADPGCGEHGFFLGRRSGTRGIWEGVCCPEAVREIIYPPSDQDLDPETSLLL